MFESHINFTLDYFEFLFTVVQLSKKTEAQMTLSTKGVNEVYVQVDALAKVHKCDVFYTNLRTTKNKVIFFFTYFTFQHVCMFVLFFN